MDELYVWMIGNGIVAHHHPDHGTLLALGDRARADALLPMVQATVIAEGEPAQLVRFTRASVELEVDLP